MRILILLFLPILLSISSSYAESSDQYNRKEAHSIISILVLDMNNDGEIFLSQDNQRGSVYWDIDLDGHAEAVEWISPYSAILAINKKNEDGNIHNQANLFGNETEDGFTVLSAYDQNKDQRITREDDVWTKLYLWFDKNTDGYAQKDELYTLDEFHIKSINLTAESYPEPITANQRISASSEFVMEVENSGLQAFKIYNVLPIFDNVNTVYNKDYKLDVRALFLPTLRGFGNLPDLHIAISNDEELLNMVKNLAVMNIDQAFSPNTHLEEQFEALLFRWANAQDVPIDSRGPNINAKRLAFLEALLGKAFRQTGAGGTPNPLPDAANSLKAAYQSAFQNMFSHFMVQAHGRRLFANNVQYEPVLSTITDIPELNYETLEAFKIKSRELPKDQAASFWERYVRIINWDGNISNMSDKDLKKLSDSISTSTHNMTLNEILGVVNDNIGAKTQERPKLLSFNDLSRNHIYQYLNYILIGLALALALILVFNRNNLFKR